MALIRTGSTTWEDNVDPTVNSDSSVGYQTGDYHRNTATGDVFYIKDTTVGAAVWVDADPSGGGSGGTYFKAEVTITSTTPTVTPASASDQIVPGLTYTITQSGDYVFYAMVTGDLDNTDAKPFEIMLALNSSIIANSKTGDFMKKNEAQSVSLTFPIDGLVATDVIDVYINNDDIDVEIVLGRILAQSWA